MGTRGLVQPNPRLKTNVENTRLFRLACSPRLSRIPLALESKQGIQSKVSNIFG